MIYYRKRDEIYCEKKYLGMSENFKENKLKNQKQNRCKIFKLKCKKGKTTK